MSKQGDTISLSLFNSVIESILKRVKKRWENKGWGVQLRWAGAEKLTNLRFADDILLVARSLPQVKKMLSDIAKAVSEVGLELHPKKTKVIHNNIGYGSAATSATIDTMTIEILNPDTPHPTWAGR